MAVETVVGGIYEHFKSTPKKRMLYEVVCVAEGLGDGKVGEFIIHARDCNTGRSLDVIKRFGDDRIFLSGVKEGGKYVIYQQLYKHDNFPMGTIWVRSYENFVEEITRGGQKVKRFTRVENLSPK
ncbi:MAG: DUF1653 domain-containing protein [Nanoarchaeota archaeon]|nr:DUF1653 domain-containing protein [Nanoarchaeota archaeon]